MTAIDASAEGGGLLHRALRDDVRLPWVRVAPGGPYEVVHEDGDVDGPGGVIRIELFEVVDDDAFLAAWHARRDVFAAQRGYLGTRLYIGGPEHRFVDYARWSSPLMVFRAANLPPPAIPVPSDLGVYERR